MIARVAFLAVLMLMPATAIAAVAQVPVPADGPMLVVPFENRAREPRLYWLQEGSAVLLADSLNSAGASAVTRNERLSAFERLELPPIASLSRATVIKVGQLVGASEVIVGSLEVDGDVLTVKAQSIQLDSGRLRPEVVEQGPIVELIEMFDRVAGRLVSTQGGKPSAAGGPTHPPLGAFENYIKGLLAEAPATKIKFLEAALDGHARYDRAYLALWEVHTEAGEHRKALEAALAVPVSSERRRIALFRAGLSQLELETYDEAFETFTKMIEEAPTAALYNNLGVLQLRRGWTPQTGRPTYFFHQAVQSDPDDANYLFNLGYAFWLEKDPQAALYWLREAVRRDPADADAHFVLAAALRGTGATSESVREMELAEQLAAKYDRAGGGAPSAVPTGLERVERDLQTPRAERLEAALIGSARREQQQLSGFHVGRARRLIGEEKEREAEAELRRAIFLSPYDPEAHLLLGRLYLRAGRVRDAIDALKISVWSDETAENRAALGHAYLLAEDVEAARQEAERALLLDAAHADAKLLLEKTKAARLR